MTASDSIRLYHEKGGDRETDNPDLVPGNPVSCLEVMPTRASTRSYPSSIMPRSLHLQAPAKLNLCLSVGPPGPDRMHPIASWMVTIDLQDEVELERLEEPALSMYAVQWHRQAPRKAEIDWPMSRDLAARANKK